MTGHDRRITHLHGRRRTVEVKDQRNLIVLSRRARGPYIRSIVVARDPVAAGRVILPHFAIGKHQTLRGTTRVAEVTHERLHLPPMYLVASIVRPSHKPYLHPCRSVVAENTAIFYTRQHIL